MTATISLNKTGLALGAVFGLYHLMWSVLIALGGAQPVIDFILWLHMIKPFIVIEPFSLGRAAGLVAVTAVIGYALGWSFALSSNAAHR